MSTVNAAIAAHRFGMGAHPDELAKAKSDPRGYLIAQLHAPDADPFPSQGLQTSQEAWTYIRETRQALRASRMRMGTEDIPDDFQERGRRHIRQVLLSEIEARTRFAVQTKQSFRERWVRFWSNHFTVSAAKGLTGVVAGAFEREVIRAHAFGRFEDLLLAAESHPAMLIYLDNAQSVGPNSRAGRRRDRGLNENLAREALELHTVSPNAGYSQHDVEELAKALTGWSVTRPESGQPQGMFRFHSVIHEPGARTVLGVSYREGGVDQARSIFKDLARHPATADHIARKLASHFISDQPPETTVTALAQAFQDSDGDLTRLAMALVRHNEAWLPEQSKMRTPEEFLIATLRAADRGARTNGRDMRRAFYALGQIPLSAPSPAGWSDSAQSWAGPDGLMKRLEWAHAVSARIGDAAQPMTFVDQILGDLASDHTRSIVSRAASAQQGLTLAMMSPEFQRR